MFYLDTDYNRGPNGYNVSFSQFCGQKLLLYDCSTLFQNSSYSWLLLNIDGALNGRFSHFFPLSAPILRLGSGLTVRETRDTYWQKRYWTGNSSTSLTDHHEGLKGSSVSVAIQSQLLHGLLTECQWKMVVTGGGRVWDMNMYVH